MKKTLTIVAVVGLAAVLLAGPALASGTAGRTVLADEPVQPPNHIIALTGTIEQVDSQSNTIEVTIQMTNNPYIGMRGDKVWVHTTTETLYFVWFEDVRTPATFAELIEGQSVSINADVVLDTIIANRVEVDKPRY